MKKSLLLLFVLFAFLGCKQQSMMMPEVLSASDDTPFSVQASDDRQQHEAVIADGRDIYRICSTRPQRVLPSHSSNTQRTTCKLPVALRHQYGQTLKHFYSRGRRTERAPFCFVVSRDYYVIALRHIIR